ncbi:putative mitochondrial ribosomal protein dap3 protein [Coleophoma cylindrospora]|uniref:Small ribosomal subunit protein mS29 n=1 Tax=Coleophoma cylindrospora TaxID=1849047 RepID=A0A3D8QSN6_9HELO|nr:putative mitochondrial ribosomal protein dap3 protein [Coleophoma cylindrospora]
MASSGCWKCLLRPSIPVSRPIIANASASFSTTTTLNANPPKKKTGAAKIVKPHQRAGSSLKIKKKAYVKPAGRPPMPGERKALRKRIVLSNTNALEVPMTDLSKDNLLDETLVGKVAGLPDVVVDQLRAVEAFKITQGWGLFRRPAILVREDSVKMARMLEAATEKKETCRVLLDGQRGAGKSMLAVHALASAFLKGWIVINIPEAQELTTATTDYSPIPNTTPQLYSQNTYVANLLSQIGKANNAVLSTLTLSMEHKDAPIPLQSNISLARLVELGARDPDVAWPLFNIFWREITAAGRPPVMMAMDGLSYCMQYSEYRNPDFELIHAHDLALVKHLLDHLSGSTKLPNGGAILGVMSRSHAPKSLAADLAITQTEERQLGRLRTKADPFTKYDERSLKVLSNVPVLRLQGLSRAEARGLMEYWASSGVMRTVVNEKTVAEKWALAGNGIVGEIERGVLRMRI